MSHEEGMFDFAKSDFTETVHREAYSAIAPTRPELNQAGKVILITGGGDNLGYVIANAFIQAAADAIIIVGRRIAVLSDAKARLEQEAKAAGKGTRIVAHACDITVRDEVDAMWKELNSLLGTAVDVFISNAAKPPQPKKILEAGTEEIWSQLEANVKAPMYMAERFASQPSKKQKVNAPSSN